MQISRFFEFPNSEPFQLFTVRELFKRILPVGDGKVIIDPFARNSKYGTIRNDINPGTGAEYHMDVYDFLRFTVDRRIKADVILFDPPYSPTQLKRQYQSAGLELAKKDTMRNGYWKKELVLINKLLKINGYFIKFGWNSSGFNSSIHKNYSIEEIILINHGAAHNDTIIVIEKKRLEQTCLFDNDCIQP